MMVTIFKAGEDTRQNQGDLLGFKAKDEQMKNLSREGWRWALTAPSADGSFPQGPAALFSAGESKQAVAALRHTLRGLPSPVSATSSPEGFALTRPTGRETRE